jgi:hypothetical protein
MRRRAEEEMTLIVSDSIEVVSQQAKKTFWGKLLAGLLNRLLNALLDEILNRIKSSDVIEINEK